MTGEADVAGAVVGPRSAPVVVPRRGGEQGGRGERGRGAWWATGTACCVLAVAGLSLASAPPPIVAPWDVFILLDGGYRVAAGQIPHTDFANPVGPLVYVLVGLALRVGGPGLVAVARANVVVLLIVAALAWRICRSRVPVGYAAAFTVFAAITVSAVRPLGYAPGTTSYAMLYNRYGWVLFALLLVQVLLPARQPWNVRRQLVEGLVLGLLLGLLFYTKITFFVAGVAAVVLGVLMGALPRPRRFWAALAAAALGIGLALRLGVGVRPQDYLGDVLDAALVQGGSHRLHLFAAGVAHTLPVAVLLLVVLGSWWASVSRDGASLRPVVVVGLTCVGVFAACLLLTAGDADEHGELPALAVLPLLVLGRAGPGSPPASGGRPARRWGWRPVRVRAFSWSVAALVALTVVAPAGRDGLGLAHAVAGHGLVAHPPPGQRLAAAPLRDFVIPADADWRTAYRVSHAVPAMVNDGIGLLRRHVSPHDRVFTVALTDPFSAALGLPPRRGGLLWWDLGYDFDARHHPPADQVLGEADWVMVPRAEPGQGCCQETVDVMLGLYSAYLGAHFTEVGRTSGWILLRRSVLTPNPLPHGARDEEPAR